MISKLFCLLVMLSLQMQGREASIVPVVETIPEITVTFGEEGLLKCGYEHKPFAVYWRFMSDSSSIDLLVVLDQQYQVGERSGPGYDEGRFNITNDFSLVIHSVRVEDEGRYICEVSDFETGQLFRNYTNVTVTVQAVRPLVRVHQCGSDNRVSMNVTDNPKASCMIQITSNQRHVQLDCFVEGAKPQVHMTWFDNTTLHDLSNGTSVMTTNGKREGTVDQKLTVILEASEFQSEQEYYFTCTAEGAAVGGIASVTVGVNNDRSGDDDIQMDIETCTPLMEKKNENWELLLDKRKQILNYSPDGTTTMKEDTGHINLGVFGLTKAGKSSFINSLIFSVTGNYPGDEADNRATTSQEGDSTRHIEDIKLTDHIHLLNYKGMMKYDQTQIKEILSKIKGQKKEIHCSIFICDSRNNKEQCEEFMKSLSKKVYCYFGRGIILVIPNKGHLDGDDDTIKGQMSNTIDVTEDHVWIFDNYTLESHEEDVEKSTKFLDFILHCVTVAKGNQQFLKIQKEKKWWFWAFLGY